MSALAALTIGLIGQASFAAQVNYAYDSLGRLIEATYDNGTDIVYSYDAAGNRTSQALFVPGGAVPNSDGTSANINCNGVSFTQGSPANSSTGIACFQGAITAYNINPNANGGVTVSGGPEGAMSLTNVVLLVFANNTYLLTLNQDQAVIARLYRAMFSVPPGMGTTPESKLMPDAGSILFWYSPYETVPAAQRANAAGGAQSPMPGNNGGNESLVFWLGRDGRFTPNANLSSGDFVAAMYWNALNRAPNASEQAYYVNLMAAPYSLSPETIAAYIANSEEAMTAAQWPGTHGTEAVPGWMLLVSTPGTPAGS